MSKQTPQNNTDTDNALDGGKLEEATGFFAKLSDQAETSILVVLRDGIGWQIFKVSGNPFSARGAVGTLQEVDDLVGSENHDKVTFRYCEKNFVFENSACKCGDALLWQYDLDAFDGVLNKDGTQVLITVDLNTKKQ